MQLRNHRNSCRCMYLAYYGIVLIFINLNFGFARPLVQDLLQLIGLADPLSSQCPLGWIQNGNECRSLTAVSHVLKCPPGYVLERVESSEDSEDPDVPPVCRIVHSFVSSCPEGFTQDCSSTQTAGEACECSMHEEVALIGACPSSSKMVEESEKCVLEVRNPASLVCNHGWVYDEEMEKCRANHAVDAKCRCPDGTRFHRNSCMMEDDSECPLDDADDDDKQPPHHMYVYAAKYRMLRKVSKCLKTKIRAPECFCPDGTPFKTTHSSLDWVRGFRDKPDALLGLVMPPMHSERPGAGTEHVMDNLSKFGKRGCITVDYTDPIDKCSDQNNCLSVVELPKEYRCPNGFASTCKTDKNKKDPVHYDAGKCKCERTIKIMITKDCPTGTQLEMVDEDNNSQMACVSYAPTERVCDEGHKESAEYGCLKTETITLPTTSSSSFWGI